MIERTIHILLLTIFMHAVVGAQETIVADTTSGCDSLTVRFTLENGLSADSYSSIHWDFGDDSTANGSLTVIHTYLRPGDYTVRCLLDGALEVVATDVVSVGQTPYAAMKFSDTDPTGAELTWAFEPAYFRPDSGIIYDYTWRFPDGTEVLDSVAEHTFFQEGIYDVFLGLKDRNGCADSVVTGVPVSKQLMVPNTFTPNGDEINDHFRVTTPGDFTYDFRVYSRSGMEVYASESGTISWDGRSVDGREAPEGVYFYTIQGVDTPVETTLSGFLHLFR